MIAVSIAMAIWTGLLVWMHVRTEKRRETENTASTVAEKEHGMSGFQETGPRGGEIGEKV